MRQRHTLMILMAAVFFITFFWESIPAIKNTAHWILDPTLGGILNWNLVWGMTLVLVILNLAIVLAQKYATDQETLKEIKKEQKEFQKELKEYKDNPDKMLEMNKKQMEFFKQTFIITSRVWVFTMIPLVLLFRWFNDYFSVVAEGFRFFGYLSWFWFYLLISIVFTTIFRKIFKVV